MEYHVATSNTMLLHRISCSYMKYHVATSNTMWLHGIPCGYIEYHVATSNTMSNNLASSWWRASALDRLESCHGIEWTLVMGSNGLLSLDRLESCHGIDWSLVMGSVGLLSWASGGLLVLALPHQRLSTKACARAWNFALGKKNNKIK